MVKSPCKLICRYENGMCQGCYRTLHEISNWEKFSDDEKRKVLKKINKRRPNQDYYGFP